MTTANHSIWDEATLVADDVQTSPQTPPTSIWDEATLVADDVQTSPQTPPTSIWDDADPVSDETLAGEATQRQQKLFWAEVDAGRPLSTQERAKIYQDDLAARGQTQDAMALSRGRAEADNAARDAETAEKWETALRAPYLVLRGVENGLTLGLSKPIFAAMERAQGGRVQAESTGEALAEGAGELLGGVFTGRGLAQGMGGVTGKFGLTGARQMLATRLLASGVQSALSSVGGVMAGDIGGREALGNIAQSVGAAAVGIIPENFIKAGSVSGRAMNFVGQVVTDVMYDALTDGLIRDRMKDIGFQNWFITQELPQMVMSVAFATRDAADPNFERDRARIAKEIVTGFRRRVLRENLPKDIFRPTEYRGAATIPHSDLAARGPAVEGTAPREAATMESLQARMDAGGLEPELRRLSGELAEASERARTGGAGLIQVRSERDGALGWTNQGRAYPEGMDANTKNSVDKFLAGKPLTDKQLDAVERALNYVSERVSADAGHDVETEQPVPQTALKVGDSLTIRGEKYTVTAEDDDGGIRLQDGVERRALPDETLIADKGSVRDGDGKPVDVEARATGAPSMAEDPDAEAARREFWAEQAEAPAEEQPPVVVRTLEDGTRVERAGDGRLALVDAEGGRIDLDPELPDHRILIRDLDPEVRLADVTKAAQDAADRIPGAQGRVVKDEAEIPEEVRQRLESVQGPDGRTRGFAVIGEDGKPTGEYYILARNIGSPEEAERVVIHEAVVHIGVRAVLGTRLDGVLDAVFEGKTEARQAALKEIAGRYGLDVETPSGRREAAEELIAKISENQKKDPGAWKRFVAAFRDVLRKLGFKVEFSDEDIAALIGQGRRRVGKAGAQRVDAGADRGRNVRMSKTDAEADADYRGVHRAPTGRFGEGSLDAMDRTYPDDVYGMDAARIYGDRQDSSMDAKVARLIRQVRGKPESVVTVYRAVPKGVQTEIQPGDWVTPIREYAENHGTRFDEGMDIIERKVKASELFTEGNSLFEYGWQPKTPDIRRSTPSDIDPDKNLMDQVKRVKERWGRPELSQIAADPGARRIVAEVDQMRKEAGEPDPQSHLEWTQAAEKRIRENGWAREWARLKAGRLDLKHGEDVKLAQLLINRYGMAAAAAGDRDEIAAVAATVWDYRSKMTEVARTLQAGRDPVETPTARAQRWLLEALFEPPAHIARKLEGMDFAAQKAELAKHADKVGEALDALKKIGVDVTQIDEATLNDPYKVGEILRTVQITNATWGDIVYEYWRNSILSGIPTHVANTTSNVANITWELTAQRWAEAGLNLLARNPEAASFRELIPTYRSLWRSLRPAAKLAAVAFSTEQPSIEGVRFEKSGVAIPGKAGRIIRTPQRGALAADEFAKAVLIEAEITAQAYRKAKAEGLAGEALAARMEALKADPDGTMRAKAIEEARRLTFQAKPGTFARMMLTARRTLPLLWYLLPFVTTQDNILKTGLRKTPLGLFRMAAKAKAGAYATDRADLLKDSAEQLLAIAGMVVIFELTDEDENGIPRMTGSLPSEGSPARRTWERNNIPPQSIRIGNAWYSYARVEPMATAMTLMADAARNIRNSDGATLQRRAADMMNSLRSLVRDKTWLQTVGDVIRAVESSDSVIGSIGDFAQNFAASWMPNIIRSTARASDPYVRDYRTLKQDDQTMLDETITFGKRVVQKAIPISAIAPPAKRDWDGRPTAKRTTDIGWKTDFILRTVSPIQARQFSMDNLNRMIYNFNRRAEARGWEQWWPGVPDNTMTEPGQVGADREKRMTPEEYERFQVLRGKLFALAARERKWNFDSPQLAEIRGAKGLEGVLSRATAAARFKILQERTMGQPMREANDRNLALALQRASIDAGQFEESE